jgi:hypothetical protein
MIRANVDVTAYECLPTDSRECKEKFCEPLFSETFSDMSSQTVCKDRSLFYE